LNAQAKSEKSGFRSGFAAIIGKPNVGKSTLLNRLIAEKIAAISSRPQTTRNQIRGICHLADGQIVFLDTPGIHQSEAKFNRCMVRASTNAFSEADVILFLLDAEEGFRPEDEFVFKALARAKPPVILVINKIDRIAKGGILVLIDAMRKKERFAEIVPISALSGDGINQLKSLTLKYLPLGPEYYPEGMSTDSPEQFIVGEMIREKVFRLTHKELPYSVAVEVEGMAEGEKGVLVIDAVIYTEKPSQKKILIGEKGDMLKKIGTTAREEIEKRFGVKVYLTLFIKVKKNWRTDDRCLKEFGYIHDSH
jgi:GTP-binding protein Era